ncbi:MAG: glycosyltransferase family 4 protein [Planctomycetota bacterium]|jgi:glycosyltransferase involved in cell wall biosynthesis
MRLLITFGLYQPSIGGAEEVCRRLAEGMAHRGHEVTVATATDPERQGGEHNGVRIVPFDISGNWALDMHGDVEAYQRFLMAGDFDLTFHYAAQIWTTDLVLPLLGQLPAPAVLAPCGYSALHDPRYARYFARLPDVLPGFAALVHHSDIYRDAQYARDAGLPRCVTIPNGTDPQEFEQAGQGFRAVLGVENRPLVLTVSNHTGGKGHDLVISAFQAVAPHDAVLVIIGNDSPNGCMAQCRSTEDLRVMILENLPRKLVVQAFLESDVFLLGSQVEAAPLVLLEAMAAGLPWISTPVGNVRELAGGIIADPPRFPEQLGLLLRDKRVGQQLGERGRSWSQSHSQLPQIHDQYEHLFHRVVGGELRGTPVPAETLAMDMDRMRGLAAFAGRDWQGATTHLMHSIEHDPSTDGLRLTLLTAMMQDGHRAPLSEIYELVQDELELTPWLAKPNMLLFLLGGALELDLDLQEAEERAVALGLPGDQLMDLARRGRELSAEGENIVQDAVLSLMAS